METTPQLHYPTGTIVEWPKMSCRILSGELRLILQAVDANGAALSRYSLCSLTEDKIVPAFDITTTNLTSCSLTFSAIFPSSSQVIDCGDVRSCWVDLISEIFREHPDVFGEDLISCLNDDESEDAGPSLFCQMVVMLLEHHKSQEARSVTRFNLTDAGSQQSLFLSLEDEYFKGSSLKRAKKDNNVAHFSEMPQFSPYIEALKIIASRLDVTVKIPARAAIESDKQALIMSIQESGLLYREILLNDHSFEADFGDCIGFSVDEPQTIYLLLSKDNQYFVQVVGEMNGPVPISSNFGLIEAMNPRVVSILPSFSDRSFSLLELIQFSYGKPKNGVSIFVTLLLAGLIVGFLLTIGKDVGAIRWIFAMACLGGVLGAVLGLLPGGFRTGLAVTTVSTGLAMLTPTFNTLITNQALPDRDFGLLAQMCGILLVAAVVRVALAWIEARSLTLQQQRGAPRSQFALMSRMLSLSTDFFSRYSFGDLQLRFMGLETIREEISSLMSGGLFKAITSLMYMLFMLRTSVKLTLLTAVIALSISLPTIIVGLQARSLQQRQEVLDGVAQARNLELVSSTSKLRLAGAEAAALSWWAESYKGVVNLEALVDAKEAISEWLQEIVPHLGRLLLFALVANLMTEAAKNPNISSFNAGQLLGFFSAFAIFVGAVASLASLFVQMFDVPVYYERVRPILETLPESTSAQSDPGLLTGRFSLDRVSYRYEDESPLILDQVSLQADPGEFVAIVGPSGSGKSTLIRMLLGFGEPEDGSVMFDGQPFSGLDRQKVRQQIGTVLQTSSIFPGSLFEVIAGGRLVSQEDAWKAAELVALDDFIRELPMGMNTVLMEGGGSLSGGQKQRILIARALVGNPKLLIFDEATSALDNATQASVTESLNHLDVTRVVIAHRLSTIRDAQRIYVLDSGQVVQVGSFDQLMEQHGLFQDLMRRQLA